MVEPGRNVVVKLGVYVFFLLLPKRILWEHLGGLPWILQERLTYFELLTLTRVLLPLCCADKHLFGAFNLVLSAFLNLPLFKCLFDLSLHPDSGAFFDPFVVLQELVL